MNMSDTGVFVVAFVENSNTYELVGISSYSKLAHLCVDREVFHGKFNLPNFRLLTKVEDPVYVFRIKDIDRADVLEHYEARNPLGRDDFEFYKKFEEQLTSFKVNSEDESVTALIPKTFNKAIEANFVIKYHQGRTYVNTGFATYTKTPEWVDVTTKKLKEVYEIIIYAFDGDIIKKI
jgi:hypothetical protein